MEKDSVRITLVDLAQILIMNGHSPEAVSGYAMCTMEAYADSTIKMMNSADRRSVMNIYVGSQGDHKAVKKHLKSLEVKSSDDAPEFGADQLVADITAGFKGIKD